MVEFYSYNQLCELIQNDIDRIEEFRNIPNDLITLKPDPSTWSAAEALRHIIKFNKLYISQMDEALKTGERIKAEKEHFRPRFIFRQAIRFFEPPYKVKLKTIAPMYPNNRNGENPQKSLTELEKINQNLINQIETFRAEKLDLDRIRGKNPLLKWLPMSLSEFILLLEAHQRRHFWQIEQILLKLSGERF